MPFINLRDTPIRLPAGQLRIGRGRDVEITLPAAPAHAHNAADSDRGSSNERAQNGANGGGAGSREGQFALLVVDASGSATLSKLSNDAPVYLNSVPAGLEPTPLLHGDRMEIDGVELRFSDDRATGATAEFPVWTAHQGGAPMPIAGLPAPAGGANREAPRQSARVRAPVKNGRLISQTDGREYAIPNDGLVIGRDAGCDVVVPANSVSRKHARIGLDTRGYTITDSSTNGIIVSGEKVRSNRLLKRGDTVRVGPEEFRFYEEQVDEDPTPAVPNIPVRIDTPRHLQPAERPKAPVLATLVVANQGVDRGKVFEIGSLLTHIGRGAHNDIVLSDDSVSDSHAKLQWRENRWVLMDVGSTNGTYVGGARLTGEVELQGDMDVRFGGAKLVFKHKRGTPTPSAGTRVVAAYKKNTTTPDSVAAIDSGSAETSPEEIPDETKRSLAMIWFALLSVIALTLSVIIRALL